MAEKKWKFDTLAIRGGQQADPTTGAVAAPIYQPPLSVPKSEPQPASFLWKKKAIFIPGSWTHHRYIGKATPCWRAVWGPWPLLPDGGHQPGHCNWPGRETILSPAVPSMVELLICYPYSAQMGWPGKMGWSFKSEDFRQKIDKTKAFMSKPSAILDLTFQIWKNWPRQPFKQAFL